MIAFTDTESTVDLLLTPNAKSKLAQINLKPIAPPDIVALKTILARLLEDEVGGRSASDISSDLKHNHPDWNLEVIKIPDRTRFFKLTCPDTNTAQAIKALGLILFNTRITPDQISPQAFIPLKKCLKCYFFEDHATAQCTSTTPICSEVP